MNYIKILRPINLLIVALTQYCTFFLLLRPLFLELPITVADITPVLDGGLIHLFVLATLCITAGGFIINDIIDYDIDITNKPEKTYIGKNKISFQSAKNYYFIISILGLVFSIFIGWKTDKMPLVIIYPISVLLLYLYSKIFKGKTLIGNVIVALFSTFVSGIIFFAESSNIRELGSFNVDAEGFIMMIAVAYMSFGFFSSMYREIIKDIEDIEGDKKQNLSTLPIRFGVYKAKIVAIIISFCLTTSFYSWIMMFQYTSHEHIYTIIFGLTIVFPSIFLLYKTILAKAKKDYSNLSQWTKALMLMSIVLFVLICMWK